MLAPKVSPMARPPELVWKSDALLTVALTFREEERGSKDPELYLYKKLSSLMVTAVNVGDVAGMYPCN